MYMWVAVSLGTTWNKEITFILKWRTEICFCWKVAQNWFIAIYIDRLSSHNLKPDGWIGFYGH